MNEYNHKLRARRSPGSRDGRRRTTSVGNRPKTKRAKSGRDYDGKSSITSSSQKGGPADNRRRSSVGQVYGTSGKEKGNSVNKTARALREAKKQGADRMKVRHPVGEAPVFKKSDEKADIINYEKMGCVIHTIMPEYAVGAISEGQSSPDYVRNGENNGAYNRKDYLKGGGIATYTRVTSKEDNDYPAQSVSVGAAAGKVVIIMSPETIKDDSSNRAAPQDVNGQVPGADSKGINTKNGILNESRAKWEKQSHAERNKAINDSINPNNRQNEQLHWGGIPLDKNVKAITVRTDKPQPSELARMKKSARENPTMENVKVKMTNKDGKEIEMDAIHNTTTGHIIPLVPYQGEATKLHGLLGDYGVMDKDSKLIENPSIEIVE